MKKREIIELKNLLDAALPLENNNKFRYAVFRNMGILEPHFKALKKMEDDDRAILKNFDEERNNLILKLGKQGDNGMVSIPETDKEAIGQFYKKLIPIQKKYEKELKEWGEKNKEFQKTLDEDMDEEIKFYHVALEFVPEKLPSSIMESLVEYGIIIE